MPKKPLFTIGSAAGGVHELARHITWRPGNYSPNRQYTGPFISNMLYNLMNSGQNLNILFNVQQYDGNTPLYWCVFIYPYVIECTETTVKVNEYDDTTTVATFTYNNEDDARFYIDSQYKVLKIYINDIKITEFELPDAAFEYAKEYSISYPAELGFYGQCVRFDLIFPSKVSQINLSYSDPETYHGCKINHFSLEAEDWQIDPLVEVHDWPMIDYLNFGLLAPVFNNVVTDLNFNAYNKLKVDFQISDMSYTYDRSFTPEQLWDLKYDYANYPGVKLLFVLPVFSDPYSGNRDSANDNHSLIQVYKSSEEGIVYVFSKYGWPSPGWTYHAMFPSRKLIHMENKKVSIIFPTKVLNTYSVYVDDELVFTDELCHTDQTWYPESYKYLAVYPPTSPISRLTIGNTTSREGFYPINGYETRPAFSYRNYGIKFDLIKVSYIR